MTLTEQYGPLTVLIGKWYGDEGLDKSPMPDGMQQVPFYEEIDIHPAGSLKNAQSQPINMIRYHKVARRKANDEVFHDESGYWMWDSERNLVTSNMVIPRSFAMLCGGSYKEEDGKIKFNLSAKYEGGNWGILQSPFLLEKAKTLDYERQVISDGKTLSYFEKTIIDIYGNVIDHTDENKLKRIEPYPII